MINVRGLLALLPLTVLCACASAPGGGPGMVGARDDQPSVQASAGETPYGLFLAGQAAINEGHDGVAADYFDRAASVDGGSDAKFLTARAFTAALLAGDVAKAAALAPNDADTIAPVRRLGVLTQAVEDLSDGKAKAAHTLLGGLMAVKQHEPAVALLAPWAAAAAGDTEGCVILPVIVDEPISQFFGNLNQGKLFERARRFDESETAFRSLIASGDPGGIASRALGEMLERRGRSADALAIYDRALIRVPDDAELKADRARAAAHGKAPPLPTLRQGAADALIAPATSMIVQKQQELALAYLRLALRLDPNRDETWMLTGDVLSGMGDMTAAKVAYLAIKPGSEQYVAARGKLAWAYQNDGDKSSALKAARETVVMAPASQDAAVTLADILRADEQFAESAKVLDGLIAGQGDKPDWRLLYMRAVDLQESGRWADAERDLSTALKLRPNEPELLNFLAYAWIDRGEKLPEAMSMIKKAVDLNPKSGAMIDSLGWGYYRLGDYKTAVEKLEEAVVLEPADPDVNNHLGDAYWRVGRQVEAQFQWRRVLSLNPSSKLKTEVDAKLKSGLESAAAPARVARR